MKSVEEIAHEEDVATFLRDVERGLPPFKHQWLAATEALRSVREAALAEGRERERAAVVEWLNEQAWACPSEARFFLSAAAVSVKRGDHVAPAPANETSCGAGG